MSPKYTINGYYYKILTFEAKLRVVEVEHGRIGGRQDWPMTLFSVNLHYGGDEIADHRFRRHNHLYGVETPLDRHVQQCTTSSTLPRVAVPPSVSIQLRSCM